jgi:hypothetical protein
MAVLFCGLIVASAGLGIVLASGRSPATVWPLAGVVAALPLSGYVLSRSVALPQLEDHVGDWLSSAGSPCAPGSGDALRRISYVHALELAGEGFPLQHHPAPPRDANLGTISVYLQGTDPEEIIAAVHTRRAPMMSASAGLRL